MHFELNEFQEMLKDSVTRFLGRDYDLDKRRALIHAKGGFSEDHWSLFAEMGWIGASLPEALGGLGGDAADTTVILEAFGGALVVEPLVGLGILPARILMAGNPAAQALVPAIIGGQRRIAVAHGEVAARGDLSHVETRARPDGDGHVLDGMKSLVLGAPFADSFIISARVAGDSNMRTGISVFLVPKNMPGISVKDFRLADGSRAAELSLTGVRVDPSMEICPAGEGFELLDDAFAHAMVAVCAEAVGAMDRALWITRDYVQTRNQFGQAIGTFQSIQHRMADMLIQLELARSALFRALSHVDAPAPERRRALALAKAQIGKSARFVGGQAIQLHGGIGITEEYVIGHYFKRLVFLDNLFGSVSRQLELVAQAG